MTTLTRLLAFILLFPSLASAIVLFPDGVKPEVTYTEPTTYTDGSALKDLARICAYWTVDTMAQRTTCWPASGPTGGSTITKMAFPDLVPILPGEHRQFSVQLTAGTATLESVPTPVAALDVNRSVVGPAPDTTPPPTPAGLTVVSTTPGPTSVTFVFSWTPTIDQPSNTAVPTYTYTGALDAGTGAFSGSVTTPSLTLVQPYPANGLATTGWFCLKAQDAALNPSVEAACTGLVWPAKPIPPPPPPPNPPVGAPQVSQAVNSCDVVLTATQPDATTGWTARFRMDNDVAFGTTDATIPYNRSKTRIPPGPHKYYVEWLKGTVLKTTSPAAEVPCP